jgi:CheY-like chemotaxis protein
MYKGHITVESREGEGSKFRVAVPVRKVCTLPSSSVAQGLSRVESPGRAEASRRETILVAEDNPVNQKVISAILRKHGYGVAFAMHGGEVMGVLERQQISLILMDIQMPLVDGLEATRMVRRDPRWSGLPVIAMTAHAMAADRDMCLREGMDGYLSKPVNRAQLLAMLETHLSTVVRGRRVTKSSAGSGTGGGLETVGSRTRPTAVEATLPRPGRVLSE